MLWMEPAIIHRILLQCVEVEMRYAARELLELFWREQGEGRAVA